MYKNTISLHVEEVEKSILDLGPDAVQSQNVAELLGLMNSTTFWDSAQLTVTGT